MIVNLSLEQKFSQTPDGTVWTQGAFAYPFWLRYLEVFEKVRVVARVQHVSTVSETMTPANGDRVEFLPLPYYEGPLQYTRNFMRIRHIIAHSVSPDEAMILRVPSAIASVAIPILSRRGQPYGVEVVGDPYYVFAPGSVRHPLRRFFRWWSCAQLRQHCMNAIAAAYVTKSALQRNYPANPEAVTSYYSDVELSDAAYVRAPRTYGHEIKQWNLVIVGSLAQPYKAVDILLLAIHRCIHNNLLLHLTIIGDGKYRGELENLAQALGISENVSFIGQLPSGEAIRAKLDAADLFILPSRTEGLPRAMLEAMARGLPCIGSEVGGIPELLDREDLVPPENVDALAQLIQEVLTNPLRLAKMSTRNLAKARDYAEPILCERRNKFYQHVLSSTEEWKARQR